MTKRSPKTEEEIENRILDEWDEILRYFIKAFMSP